MPKEIVYKPTIKYAKKLDTPLQQKKEYNKTFSEWIVVNSKRVSAVNYKTNIGTASLYTVPKNYNLLIGSLQLSLITSGAGGGIQPNWSMITILGADTLLVLYYNGTVIQPQTAILTPTIPLLLKENQELRFVNLADGVKTAAVMNGYLIPNNILLK